MIKITSASRISCLKIERNSSVVSKWLFLLGLLLWVTASIPAEPSAEPKPVFRGISYLHQRRQKPRPMSLHLAVIDQTARGIRYLVTPPNPNRKGKADEVILKKTSTFASQRGAQLAVNGTFFIRKNIFDKEGSASGVSFLAVYDGMVYSDFRSTDEVIVRAKDNHLELWVEKGSAEWEFKKGDGQMALGMARWAQLLRNGENVASRGKDTHPRTAVGASQDGKKAYLLVVDGRQKGLSEGLTLYELAEIMKTFGAADAINLDGGGSSTFVMQQPDKSYRIMSLPSDFYPLSVERPVGTHLAVFAEALE